MTSEVRTFELCDIQAVNPVDAELKFTFEDLPKHADKFGFITGMEKKTFKDQDPVNMEAAERVGALYDGLEQSG